MKVSAVIFDVDGLMIDSERITRTAWRLAMAEYDYSLEDDIFTQVIGKTIIDTRQFFKQVYGCGFPFNEIYERRQVHLHRLYNENGIPIKPGLHDLLDFLQNNQIKIAVATSSATDVARKKLRVAGLFHLFGTIVYGDDVENGKPAPDIFLIAANKLGVSPEDCLVLEDSEAGIVAAHAAGMKPVMVPDIKQPDPEIMHLALQVLPSLSAVKELLSDLMMS